MKLTRKLALPLTLLLVLSALTTIAIAQTTRSSEEAAIEKVIRHAYVEGAWMKRDESMMREGFAPTFIMQLYRNGEFASVTLDAWIERINSSDSPINTNVRGEVKVLDITGSAAVARVEFYVDSKHVFTDYFSLYKTDAGWKIVAKHFHAH